MSMREIIPRVFKNLGKFPSIQIPFLAVFINSIAKSSKGKRKIRTSSSPLRKKKRRENNVESNLTSIEKMPKMLYGSCIIPSRFDETKARDANVISSRTNGYGLPTILFRPSFPNFRVYVSLWWFSIEPRSMMKRSRSEMRWNRTENHISSFLFLDPRDTTMINIDNFILIFCYHLFQLLYGIIRISLYFLLSLN